MSAADSPRRMGEDGEMNRRVLPTLAELAPAPALEDDNLLAEFLLRLPPLPSSLRRASLVCKRWRRLVSDPHFLRRFRSYHKKPPLLGFIYDYGGRSRSTGFISALDSPDRIPASHFSLQLGEFDTFVDCHHGLVLFYHNRPKEHVHVWDPVTRDHRYVALSPAFNGFVMDGIILCAAKDQDHVHGACHSDPFKVVLVGGKEKHFCFNVYSSDTGAWGDIISLPWPLPNSRRLPLFSSGFLIGNSVCWLLVMETVKILQFDLVEQTLAFIEVPDAEAYHQHPSQLSIMPVDSGGINFIVLEHFTVRVWKRMSSGTDVASWMLENTFDLSNLLSLRPSAYMVPVMIVASDENGNVMFQLADSGVIIMVHLGTMQFKKLTKETDNHISRIRPFSSFYIAGN